MSKNADHRFMERLLRDLQDHPQAWAFLLPVNGEDVLDYYDFIKNPMGMRSTPYSPSVSSYQFCRFSNHGAQTAKQSV